MGKTGAARATASPRRGSNQAASPAPRAIATTSAAGQKGSSVAPRAAVDDGQADWQSALRPLRARPRAGTGSAARPGRPLGRSGAKGGTELRGERRGTRAVVGIERQRAVDRREQPAWQVPALAAERRGARLDGRGDLLQRKPPEGMPSRKRLPDDDADRPDVALRLSLGACEPLGRDVRERSGDVSDVRERVGAVELREAEVEQAGRDLVPVLEQDVRRLDVAVHDPHAVRVGQRVQHLGRDLDGVGVADLVHPHRLAQRAPGDVLVRDVDVAGVVADVVRAHAAVVAQTARGERLALRARGRLPFARDDLQRDVEPRLLVAREPDRAGAPASERADRPVAAEDELSGGGNREGRHRCGPLGPFRPFPSSVAPVPRLEWPQGRVV